MSNRPVNLEIAEKIQSEYLCLKQTCGLLELDHRGRLCLTGSDRVSFLHGQITQDVKSLGYGQGAYAALVDAKGKIQSDLNVFCLKDEILLDFEKGYTETIVQRLEHHLVSEDVSIIDPSGFYTMFSVQGPLSGEALRSLFPELPVTEKSWHFSEMDSEDGAIYVCNRPRFGSNGYDLFIPRAVQDALKTRLDFAVVDLQGAWVHEAACDLARVEAGIPKMGVDMRPEHLVQETGLTSRVISFRKGCYIGQEVISRIRTVGKVNKSLCRLAFNAQPNLQDDSPPTLMLDGKEAGFVTSLVTLPCQTPRILGLGYIKRPFLEVDAPFTLDANENSSVKVRILGEPSATGMVDSN